METRIVHTKKELKEAIKDKVTTIIIAKELEKDIKPIITAKKLSSKKLARLIAALSIGGAAVVAAIAAAPTTGGISGIVAIPSVAFFSAVTAMETGMAAAEIVALLIIAVPIGIACLVELLRAYDLEESSFSFEAFGVKFERKTTYREHARKK